MGADRRSGAPPKRRVESAVLGPEYYIRPWQLDDPYSPFGGSRRRAAALSRAAAKLWCASIRADHRRRCIRTAGAASAIAAQLTLPSSGPAALRPPRRRWLMRQLAPGRGAASERRRSRLPTGRQSRRRCRSISSRQCQRARAGRSNALPAQSIMKPEAKATTANARSPRWCSTGSATRPSRRACAGSSTKARPGPPAASSPSPATARSIARPDAAGWRRADGVAEAALDGAVYAPVGCATHYHADYVVPYWASTLAKNAVVGAHFFYHWRAAGVSRAPSPTLFGPRAECRGACAAPRWLSCGMPRRPGPSTVGEVASSIPGAEASS